MSQSVIDRVLAHADEVIITAMNDSTFAGLGIGIVHQDQVIYAKGFGLAHMQQELPVTLETVFRIASISFLRPSQPSGSCSCGSRGSFNSMLQ
jgi:D-alanyl-D-alanine carboxypeptidase